MSDQLCTWKIGSAIIAFFILSYATVVLKTLGARHCHFVWLWDETNVTMFLDSDCFIPLLVLCLVKPGNAKTARWSWTWLVIWTPDVFILCCECDSVSSQIQSVLDQCSDMELQVWSSWVYMMKTLLSHRCTSSHTRYSQRIKTHNSSFNLLYSLTCSL